MAHANARLTPHGRMLLVQRVRRDKRPVSHVSKELGVSRKCGHYWLARYDAEGEAGLLDRSSRPHCSRRQTPADVEDQVVQVREQLRSGPEPISRATGVPARTVSRILARRGVPRLAECDPVTGERIRASKHTTLRYERESPGELVHMDVKKVGRVPDGGGWKAHGRGSEKITRPHDAKVGFDYVHSLVDDHSRLAYSEILTDEKGPTCAGFLTRAARYFAEHGILRIERVMTDNAWAYKWSLRAVVADLGARQVFIKPHCPWQNGKVERLNRTLQTEWAYRRPYASNDERIQALRPWLEHYNTHRPHTALGGRPPISRLQALSPT